MDLERMIELRPVPGFDGYWVSECGYVFSERGRNGLAKKKPSVAGNGYWTVALYRDGKESKRYVHHLILEAFVGPRPAGHEALHANGIRLDNRLSNLRWGTRTENAADAIRHGTATVGHRNKQAKFNRAQIARIRATRGRATAADVAAQYGVSTTTINRIRSGATYK